MQTSPFSKIIFPAILASSTVFAVLTVPVTTSSSSPLISPLSRWVDAPSLLQNQHKELSIRYIGVAIVLSAIAGLGTAELIRMRHAQRDRRQQLLKLLEQSVEQSDLGPSNLGPSDLEHLGTEPPGLAQPDRAPFEPGDRAQEPPGWGALLPTLKLRAFPAVVSPPVAPELPGESAQPPQTAGDGAALAQSVIEEDLSHLACRIQLPDNPERLLALQIDGVYYSFLQTRPTRQQALAMIHRLARQGETALATHHPRGYAVWVRQPGARPDKYTWEQWPLMASPGTGL